jgi:myosin-crossreactive antigen
MSKNMFHSGSMNTCGSMQELTGPVDEEGNISGMSWHHLKIMDHHYEPKAFHQRTVAKAWVYTPPVTPHVTESLIKLLKS